MKGFRKNHPRLDNWMQKMGSHFRRGKILHTMGIVTIVMIVFGGGLSLLAWISVMFQQEQPLTVLILTIGLATAAFTFLFGLYYREKLDREKAEVVQLSLERCVRTLMERLVQKLPESTRTERDLEPAFWDMTVAAVEQEIELLRNIMLEAIRWPYVQDLYNNVSIPPDVKQALANNGIQICLDLQARGTVMSHMKAYSASRFAQLHEASKKTEELMRMLGLEPVRHQETSEQRGLNLPQSLLRVSNAVTDLSNKREVNRLRVESAQVDVLQLLCNEIDFIWKTRPVENLNDLNETELRQMIKGLLVTLRQHREELVSLFLRYTQLSRIPCMEILEQRDLSDAFRSTIQRMMRGGKLVERSSGAPIHPDAHALIAYTMVPTLSPESPKEET